MKKRVLPLVLDDSESDLFSALEVVAPAVVPEPQKAPKLTMEQALSEPEPVKSDITVSTDLYLTAEFIASPKDSEESVRRDAIVALRCKRQDVSDENPSTRAAFKGRKFDTETVRIKKYAESRALAHYTAIGRWV